MKRPVRCLSLLAAAMTLAGCAGGVRAAPAEPASPTAKDVKVTITFEGDPPFTAPFP